LNTTDTEIRAALHRATDHLAAPPDLLADVRQGGRRRLIRRRTFLVGGLMTGVAAATAGGAWALRGSGPPMDIASPLLDEPTRGDLAGDAAFRRRLLGVWRRRMADIDADLYGEPHISWAGRTPAGPAAVMAQRSADNPVVSSAGDRLIGHMAFVRPTPDGPEVMTVESLTDGPGVNSAAALLGADLDVLLVRDTGQAAEYSTEFGFSDDGRILRTFRPVPFADGAAVLRVAPQRRRITIAISYTPRDKLNRLHISNAFEVLFPAGKDTNAPPSLTHVLPGADAAWGPQPEEEARRRSDRIVAAMAPYVDILGLHTARDPVLTVYGAVADRRLLVQTIQYDDHPAHAVALLSGPGERFEVVAAVRVQRGPALPVRLRLPGGLGILVAADGARLRYRQASGAWQPAGQHAALLPAKAAEVEVDRGSGPRVVPLS
jgi:hypothetical protein